VFLATCGAIVLSGHVGAAAWRMPAAAIREPRVIAATALPMFRAHSWIALRATLDTLSDS